MTPRRFRLSPSPYLFLLLCLALSGLSQAATAQPHRPKVALVLSGGGAKGAAHIGVLKVLEQEHIPVDMIIGTSMGSYVAGMYALGLSADEVQRLTLGLNWNQGYEDGVSRDLLSLRRKQQQDSFQLQTDLGVSDGQVKLPEGLFQGQGMAALLREASGNLPSLKSFDELPIPYRAMATDLETITPVVLDHGNLALAMQASMSIPAALKPVEIDGRLLGDGGIVNNMPVDLALAMGADCVIAVDISDSLRGREKLNSALDMVNQLVIHLTGEGTQRQIALMRPKDVLIRPKVADFNVAAFDQMAAIVPLGERAALAQLPRLDELRLSDADWRAYQLAKLSRRAQYTRQPGVYVDKIQLINHSRLSDAVLTNLLQVTPGQLQTNAELEAGVDRINALGTFERVTYRLEQQQDENVLVVEAQEKRWGPGYIDFSLGVEEDYSSRSQYSLGLSYTLTNLNDLGAEWRSELQGGNDKRVQTELYAPLDSHQRFFTRLVGGYRNETRAYYLHNLPQFESSGLTYMNLEDISWQGQLELGWNPAPWSQVAFGGRATRSHLQFQGSDEHGRVTSWGYYSRWEHDTLDNAFFPRRGWQWQGELAYYRPDGDDALVGDGDWGLSSRLDVIHPWAWDRHSLIGRFSWGGTTVDSLNPFFMQDLGGLFNLSGLQRYELNGRYKLFGGLIYHYRLMDNDLGAFKLPIYLGGSLERGGIWNDRHDISWDSGLLGGSLFVAADTFLGPVYLAYGRTEDGEDSVYLFIGNVLSHD